MYEFNLKAVIHTVNEIEDHRREKQYLILALTIHYYL
jgi:hypothetical protein